MNEEQTLTKLKELSKEFFQKTNGERLRDESNYRQTMMEVCYASKSKSPAFNDVRDAMIRTLALGKLDPIPAQISLLSELIN